MMRLFCMTAALSAGASGAAAGGVDLSGQGIGVLFEAESRAELSLSFAEPDVSGEAVPALGGGSSGDMAPGYGQVKLGLKQDFGDRFSAAVLYEQPFGASVRYPDGTGYFGQGSTASLESDSITALLRFEPGADFSLHGGLRYQTLSARADIPFIAGYTGVTDSDPAVGYVLGAAYERPDIALRIALTYNSAIEHRLTSTETAPAAGVTAPVVQDITVNTPQSVNLDFQTGIAADTLLFGSVRWAEWSEFEIDPPVYNGILGEPIVSFEEDTITYSIGLGRQFTDSWSGAVIAGYEPQTGAIASNLAPTDGQASIGLAATYARGNMEVTGGLSYIWVGEAETDGPTVSPGSKFEDGTALGAGLKIAFAF